MTSSMNDPVQPKRGEVWLADYTSDAVATEMNKKGRRVIIVNADSIASGLPHRIVVPLTEWKDHYSRKPWQVKIEPTETNGITKTVAANTMQIRSIDVQKRLTVKVGNVPETVMDEITAAIAIAIDFYLPNL
jgi:mRNA interferase MazF